MLDAFDAAGVDVCYEIHPGEDLHDGVTFERFLAAVDNHPRASILYDPSHFVLQQLDYLAFIDIYHSRIKAFHVKDAEFRPTGRTGVYGGYQGWKDRAGRFRSLGDGQVDFGAIFSKLATYDFDGWAVLEWECFLKNSEDGAAEGARFIRDHIIRVTDKAFDDFAGSATDPAQLRRMLGLFTFFYGVLHFLGFAWLDMGFDLAAIVKDIGAGKPVPEVLAFVARLAAGAHSA